jgi:hypothetical protein
LEGLLKFLAQGGILAQEPWQLTSQPASEVRTGRLWGSVRGSHLSDSSFSPNPVSAGPSNQFDHNMVLPPSQGTANPRLVHGQQFSL